MSDIQDDYEDEPHEDESDSLQEPGATIMWFGKFQGTRFDQLTDHYRWTMYRYCLENNFGNWVKYRHVHDEYMKWLDEWKSPMSTKVWFGKYKGHELRVLYTRPRRWTWLLKNCTHWAPALKNIRDRYLVYKRKHPRRRPVSRAKPLILNPTGLSLGPRDDGLASDADESYDSDDGFVVRSDEEIEEEEGEESDHDDLFSDDEEQEEETIRIPSSPEVVNVDDSDDSLPSVNEIVQSSPAKRTPNKSRHGPSPYFMNRSRLQLTVPADGSSPTRPHVLSSSDDDDDDDDVPLISPFKRGRASRTIFDSDSEPGDSSRTVSDCTVVGGSSPTPNRSRAKNASSAVVVISSDSDTDDQAPQPRNQNPRPSASDPRPIDSDDEPLVPKLLRERMAKRRP
ncbi:hypothetical protein F5Y05DRAFT_352633 [Hypoxylon sp. FL0543]|nr:hypothetical protein F5Y05DRAFT_352633 [Hypoxylon sp. FL0543]